MRSRGGCSTNPSIKEINAILAKIDSVRLEFLNLNFDFATENCERDDYYMMNYVEKLIKREGEDFQDESPKIESWKILTNGMKEKKSAKYLQDKNKKKKLHY